MTSASKMSNEDKGLLHRLRDNHRWLTEQHRLWIADEAVRTFLEALHEPAI